MPLLISHGWPGSVFEFHKIMPLLTEHFTVIAPSLPGYTLSFKPGQQRFGITEIADLYAELMTDARLRALRRAGRRLGRLRRLGARASHSAAADRHPSQSAARCGATRRCWKIRTPKRRSISASSTTSSRRRPAISGSRAPSRRRWRFGLTDSPAGLAAWIVEKFHAWTDNDGSPDDAFSRDEMLANISLYWFTGAIGSSFWPYYARMHGPWPIPEGETVKAPTGYAEFPEGNTEPAALARRENIRRHSPLDHDAEGRALRGAGAAGSAGARGDRVLPRARPEHGF